MASIGGFRADRRAEPIKNPSIGRCSCQFRPPAKKAKMFVSKRPKSARAIRLFTTMRARVDLLPACFIVRLISAMFVCVFPNHSGPKFGNTVYQTLPEAASADVRAGHL